MTEKEGSQSELVELALQVVEKILHDPDLARAVAEQTGKGGGGCPPHTLCYSHICEGHGGFI